jgi:hypothetical protein
MLEIVEESLPEATPEEVHEVCQYFETYPEEWIRVRNLAVGRTELIRMVWFKVREKWEKSKKSE